MSEIFLSETKAPNKQTYKHTKNLANVSKAVLFLYTKTRVKGTSIYKDSCKRDLHIQRLM